MRRNSNGDREEGACEVENEENIISENNILRRRCNHPSFSTDMSRTENWLLSSTNVEIIGDL